MRPLDDPYDVLNLWSSIYDPSAWVRGDRDELIPIIISSQLAYMVYLLPFLSYVAGSKSVTVRPPVRPGYDDKYRSISYRFVDWQKPLLRTKRNIFQPVQIVNSFYIYLISAKTL